VFEDEEEQKILVLCCFLLNKPIMVHVIYLYSNHPSEETPIKKDTVILNSYRR